jgi:3-deoxy-D-manno-octulosonic-acid transferase
MLVRPRCCSRAAVTWRVHLGELIYQAAAHAAPPALRLAAPFHAKLRRGLDGRRQALASMRDWAARHRDPERPLAWLHAPSVGEAFMAQAILAAIREQAPGTQAVFTFFSPSAERVASRIGADWHGYLPWDRAGDMNAALDAIDPACIAFVRTEIWPVLGRLARDRGVPVLLLNAVLAEGSSRTGRGARWLLGPAYRRLDGVGAASDADADRFPILGVARDRVQVTGDARFDQVWRRISTIDRDRPLLRALAAGKGSVLVAGSTWPADEERLVAALAGLRSHGVAWRFIVAPHEPTHAHVAGIEARLANAGFSCARLPADDAAALPAVDALVVDRVGVLADLYAVADAAYVGGGFGTAGLHSVVEPAALAVPVLFGPRHGNAREADRLAAAGGGFVVRDVAGLQARLEALHGDASLHARAATAAREFVRRHTGGADRNARLLLSVLRRGSGA